MIGARARTPASAVAGPVVTAAVGRLGDVAFGVVATVALACRRRRAARIVVAARAPGAVAVAAHHRARRATRVLHGRAGAGRLSGARMGRGAAGSGRAVRRRVARSAGAVVHAEAAVRAVDVDVVLPAAVRQVGTALAGVERGGPRGAAHAGRARRRARRAAAVDRARRGVRAVAVEHVLTAAVREVLTALAGVRSAARVRRAARLRRVVADAVHAVAARHDPAAGVVEGPALELREVRAGLRRAGRAADAVRVADLTLGAVTAFDLLPVARARDISARLAERLALVRRRLRVATVRDAADAAALAGLAAVALDGIAVDGASAAVRDDAALEALLCLRVVAEVLGRLRNAARLARVEDGVALAGAAVSRGRAAPTVGVVGRDVLAATEPGGATLDAECPCT